MHEMDEGVRSGGGLVKKKNSSGCLIIKKKGDSSDVFGSSSRSVKGFQSSKVKKKPRFLPSGSESSEKSLQPFGRRVDSAPDRFRNGSVGHRNDIMEDCNIGRNGTTESERKRRLDVFEFDEYDGTDLKKTRKNYLQKSFKLAGRSGNLREFEGGSSRHAMADKRKYTRLDSASDSSEDDEAHLPISSLRQKFRMRSDEAIRVQGKNGVLKVMVSEKKKVDLPHKTYDHLVDEERKDSMSENANKKNIAVGASCHSDAKGAEEVKFSRKVKGRQKLKEPMSIKRNKAGDSDSEKNDTSLMLEPRSPEIPSSSKRAKSEGKASSSEKTPIGGTKLKRGSGTEKQLLREKIRQMLVETGWTIDYRPRRNRDYLDAVYINPTGTAYWSIIKAHDALQKQLEEDEAKVKHDGNCSAFTPLPEELLSKLTRQTRKKIKKGMKKKRRGVRHRNNVKEAEEESAESTDDDEDDEKQSIFKSHKSNSAKARLYVRGDDSSGSSYKGTSTKEISEKQSTMSSSHTLQGRNSRKIGRCTLLVRSSENHLNSESDGYVPYAGKRTLLSWLIDSETVHLSEKVQYMNRRQTKVMLEGWITRDGIHCGCCSKILTVPKFEIHAGSKLRQPFQNIYLESGTSLLQCQVDAWNRQEESERCGFHTVETDGDDPNDDTCGLCGDGGDLICCDGCPSTFHQSCLDITMLPAGDWHCPNCTCKYCGIIGGSVAGANGESCSALLRCNLCEKRYHESCSEGMRAFPIHSSRAATSFCGKDCRGLFDRLQKLLGVKHELEAGFSWSLIRRSDPNIDAPHRGSPQKVESNSKLAVALSVMDECFLPIVDRRSGFNLIHNVLYNCGSNFSRLNYSGFYTAILERGDEIVAAASIRIHGIQLAEMPFIGTRHMYRRQGMCRRLFCAIESALHSLKVQKLVIPAISEHMNTWTVAFGFSPLEESHKQEMKSLNMLVFPGTDMLQKLLLRQKPSRGKITSNSDSSAGQEYHVTDVGGMHDPSEMNDKAAATDSILQAPVVPSNDNLGLCNSWDEAPESKSQAFDAENSPSLNFTTATVTLNSVSSDVVPGMEDPVLDPPVNGDSLSSTGGVVVDVDEGNIKVSVMGPVLDSLGETSARNIAKEVEENRDPGSVSAINDGGTDGNVTQFNSSLDEFGRESEPCVTSKVIFNMEVDPVESNVTSSIKGSFDNVNQGEAKAALVESISGPSEGECPVFAFTASAGGGTIELESGSSKLIALEMESQVAPAKEGSYIEVASDAEAVPIDANTQSSTVSDSSDTHEDNVSAVAGEPVLNSLAEHSSRNCTQETNHDTKPSF